MKTILEKELKSGYKARVLVDEEGRLAVQLNNSKDEFVGQLFASEEGIADTFSQLTDYKLELTADELSSILKVTKKSKDEAIKKLRLQMRSF